MIPFSAFDGISITLGPNEPYRFVWNYVENAEKYLLTVLREDSSLVHRAEYVANVTDVYLPAGRYLWNVQAINSEKTARPFAATNVSVHQYSKIYKVPFNPQKSAMANMLHDVAWLGVQK